MGELIQAIAGIIAVGAFVALCLYMFDRASHRLKKWGDWVDDSCKGAPESEKDCWPPGAPYELGQVVDTRQLDRIEKAVKRIEKKIEGPGK